MTSRRRVLWVGALAPWMVVALVWGAVQLVASPGRSGGGEPDPARAVGAVTREAPARETSARETSAPAPDWSAILARLDQRRERAYAASDATRLREVYVRRSPVLRHDLSMLRAYRDRGVRLDGVRLRVLDVRLVDRAGPYARLRIVDRLDRATAYTSQGTVRLPRDRATARVVVLRAGAGGWRIAAVRPVAT
jgi:hypothetical protein